MCPGQPTSPESRIYLGRVEEQPLHQLGEVDHPPCPQATLYFPRVLVTVSVGPLPPYQPGRAMRSEQNHVFMVWGMLLERV